MDRAAKVAAMQRISDGGGLREVSTDVTLAGVANFGGKKAMPFGAKKGAAQLARKKMLAKAALPKGDAALASRTVLEDIELGTDGAKWKHGYIPENPAAVALKEHRKPGSKGATKGSATVKRDAAKTAAKAGGSAKPKAKTAAPKAKAPRAGSEGTGWLEGKAVKTGSKDRYLSNAERKAATAAALKRHIAVHEAAVLRAHKPDVILLHKREAAAAKRELARRAEGPAPHVSRVTKARINNPLAKLTHAEIKTRLEDPNTSLEDKITLKGEAARRVAEAHSLVAQGQDALKEALKELGEDNLADPAVAGRVFSAIYKKFPAIKPHLEKIRTSHVGKSIKDGLGLTSIFNNALNGLMVPLVGAAVTATILH